MTTDPRTIIIKPIVTERTTMLKDAENKVAFRVQRDANKIEIKKAVEKIFNIKVKNVHTINYLGKKKRLGRYQGKRSDWKKAIVTLHEGHSIEFLEGI